MFNCFCVLCFQMYRGSFPGGFPPNFQGPLHGPPRPRFPYPPENRWAIFQFDVVNMRAICHGLHELCTRFYLMRWILKSAGNEISEILKKCVLYFIGCLWICIFHRVWLEVHFVIEVCSLGGNVCCSGCPPHSVCGTLCVHVDGVFNGGAFFRVIA